MKLSTKRESGRRQEFDFRPVLRFLSRSGAKLIRQLRNTVVTEGNFASPHSIVVCNDNDNHARLKEAKLS